MLPLEGVRVLSVEQYGAGPWATLHLADLGAEVIKIEDPTLGGDVARYVPPYTGDRDSIYFQSLNRNKKSVSLNLKHPEGRAILRCLAEKADALLAQVGIWHCRDRIAKMLAHGEQRALEIGMALASDPRLLLLDEPTAGMSPEETRVMMNLIVKLAQERTVILVEHKMKLVMGISDRVLVLHHGELLADGTPSEVRQDQQVKRVYLGQREH